MIFFNLGEIGNQGVGKALKLLSNNFHKDFTWSCNQKCILYKRLRKYIVFQGGGWGGCCRLASFWGFFLLLHIAKGFKANIKPCETLKGYNLQSKKQRPRYVILPPIYLAENIQLD